MLSRSHVLILALFSLVLCHAAIAKKVLVIESYHAEYAWDTGYLKAIQEVLGKEHELHYFEMDTKRIPAAQYETKAEEAYQTFSQLDPDLVILGDDNACQYLGKKLESSPKGVVFLGVNGSPRNYFTFKNGNVSGVLERPLMKKSMGFIKSTLPTPPKRTLILLDNGTTSKIIRNEFKAKNLTILGMPIEFQTLGTWEQWQQTVLNSQKSGFDAIIIGLYHTLVDKNNQHVPAEEVIRWTSTHTPIPPFAFWSFAVGKDKSIGGYVLDGYYHGLDAAKVALEYLNTGSFAKPGSIIGNRGAYVFSQEQLSKWALKLPPNIQSVSNFTP